MRRLRLALMVSLCALGATLAAGPAFAKPISCLSASDVAKATGFAAASLQPMNMGIKVICLYNGSGGQLEVTYAVGQPFNTFTMGEHATPGAKALNGIGDGAFATTAGTQVTVNAIVKGKAEFVITSTVSLAKTEVLAKKIVASL